MAVVMEGPLSKWTNVVKGWQYRWFVLDDNTGLLSYYTSKDKMMRGTRRGCLRLKGANIGIDDEDDSTFTISCDQKTFHFQARDSEERERWIRSLEDTIKRHSQARKRPMAGFQTLFDPSQENLETRLAEAEAYHKILEQQIKALYTKMNGDVEAQGSQRYAILKETSNKMLESMNSCLRQMHTVKSDCENARKTTLLPNDQEIMPVTADHYCAQNLNPSLEDGTITSDNTAEQDREYSMEPRTLKPSKSDSSLSVRSKSSSVSDVEVNEFESSKPTSQSSRELSSSSRPVPTQLNVDNSGTRSQGVYKVSPTRNGSVVPFTSYSSSDEDEAEFFDADEYQDSGSIPSSSPPKSNPLSACKKWLDADEFEIEDEDTTGGDLDDINKHSSLITHLLSQVRLGMDLTKVVLPTFILERRSLLEMYADFFAHPDLFVDVVNYSNPKDRMVAVVRWYLSAFHAGRKGSVAKKPYNPILGETFRCFWVLPECEATRTDKCQKDGPVPWASEDDVTFIAEQVSHHPPISAFYAESFTKKISFNAHIWTKSKFLGLSVGVENIGQGCVSVLPYDEDYVLTFPNGYGRSILTVPWVEIGGKTNITCAKTGYQATIQFHCRPFYGGKKHRISCEIVSPDDRKSFLTVVGEWNGQMFAKFADKEEPELFIDTLTMPAVMKTVKKISKQEENESRRLWENVTESLKEDDVESATAFKHKLEERQRAEARERKEKGVTWETKLFHEVGENWVYDKPLVKRNASQNPRKSK